MARGWGSSSLSMASESTSKGWVVLLEYEISSMTSQKVWGVFGGGPTAGRWMLVVKLDELDGACHDDEPAESASSSDHHVESSTLAKLVETASGQHISELQFRDWRRYRSQSATTQRTMLSRPPSTPTLEDVLQEIQMNILILQVLQKCLGPPRIARRRLMTADRVEEREVSAPTVLRPPRFPPRKTILRLLLRFCTTGYDARDVAERPKVPSSIGLRMAWPSEGEQSSHAAHRAPHRQPRPPTTITNCRTRRRVSSTSQIVLPPSYILPSWPETVSGLQRSISSSASFSSYAILSPSTALRQASFQTVGYQR